ncbi:RNA chaperone Hfq, partial [Mesorhizobium sp. M7A.F.Ca.CA.001.10.2.1]
MRPLIWRIGLQTEGDRRKTRTMAERPQNLQD